MGFLQFIMQDVPVTVATTSDAELTLLDFAIKGGWVPVYDESSDFEDVYGDCAEKFTWKSFKKYYIIVQKDLWLIYLLF